MLKHHVAAGLGLLVAITAAGPACRAADIFFTLDGDFMSPDNWSDGAAPVLDANTRLIQSGLTATYSRKSKPDPYCSGPRGPITPS